VIALDLKGGLGVPPCEVTAYFKTGLVATGHLIGVNKMSAALLERSLQKCQKPTVTSIIIQFVA
jgi:hypothetical protein